MCGELITWISNDFRSMILDTLKVLLNRCQGNSFWSMGAQTGAIKLVMAGT